jgi:hypothetical protein
LFLLLLLLLLGAVLALWRRQAVRLETVRKQNAPPEVYVDHPTAGQIIPAGEHSFVAAQATGRNALMSIELWLDGQLVESQPSANPDGDIVIYGYFDLQVEEGVHMLFVRATDSAGMIGQSLPVPLTGGASISPEETFVHVFFGPHTTIEQIAAEHGVEPDLIEMHNPWIRERDQDWEGHVIVPTNPDDENESPEGAPETPPGTAPQEPPSEAAPPAAGSGGGVSIPPDLPMLEVDQALPVGNAAEPPWAWVVPTAPPAAPSDVKAEVKDCKIRVSWRSDGSNVSGYAVWFASQDGLMRLIATLKPGDSTTGMQWYEFQPPKSGVVSVWVDAGNALGSQSSPPVTVTVPGSCDPSGDEKLQFEIQEVFVPSGYDRVYAYLALEGVPERRVPNNDDVFIQVEDGWADVTMWIPGEQKTVLPIPDDGELSISGECWGWSGDELSKLSTFSISIPSAQWVGTQTTLGDERCGLRADLKPLVPIGSTMETFIGKDSTIPAPFNVRSKKCSICEKLMDQPEFEWEWFWTRDIFWQWKGDIKKITGFTILLDGKPVKTVAANQRQANVTLPKWCGGESKWEVVANGVDGTSAISETAKEQMPYCSKWVKISFLYLHLSWTCEGWCLFSNTCNSLDAYFQISVNNIARRFYGGNFYMPLKCGSTKFTDMVDKDKETVFILPYYSGSIDLWVRANFWDYDTWSGDDVIGTYSYHITWPSHKYGAQYTQDYWDAPPFGVKLATGKHITDTAKGYITFGISAIPNIYQSSP